MPNLYSAHFSSTVQFRLQMSRHHLNIQSRRLQCAGKTDLSKQRKVLRVSDCSLKSSFSQYWRLGKEPVKSRKGSYIDRDRLEETFKLLGFKVVIKDNPSSPEIIRDLKANLRVFCTEARENKAERCFVVAILAHGDRGESTLLNLFVTRW